MKNLENKNLVTGYLNTNHLGYTMLACSDNGSRAWGYNHEHSDYDYKGVFLSLRKDYYVTPFALPLETMDAQLSQDVSLAGWDFTKYLRMLHSGNAQCYELVASNDQLFKGHQLERLTEFTLDKLKYRLNEVAKHYYGLAKSTLKRSDEPTTKKLLYVARPLVSVEFMKQNRFELPPLNTETLFTETEFSDKDLQKTLLEVLNDRKSNINKPLDTYSKLLKHLELNVQVLSDEVSSKPVLVESKQVSETEFMADFNKFFASTLKYLDF